MPTFTDCWHGVIRFRRAWNRGIRKAFYSLGYKLGKRPIWGIVLPLLICGIFSGGLFLWIKEVDDVELYLPEDSPLRKDAAWVKENFKNTFRTESLIIEAENVLTPRVLSVMADLNNAVMNTEVEGIAWDDVCAPSRCTIASKYPASKDTDAAQNVHGYDSYFSDTITKVKDMTGDMKGIETILSRCVCQSVLKVWEHNGTFKAVYDLDQESIIRDVTAAVNDVGKKTTFEANQFDKIAEVVDSVEPFLSGITKDQKGNIISAKAGIILWMLKRNTSSEIWEQALIKTFLNFKQKLPDDIKIYFISERSYMDCLQEVLQNNMNILIAGLALIVIYVIAMVGKFNWVEKRLYISLLGVLTTAMSMSTSFGACFYMGFFWGPLHPVLPFLLMGIGVDNIFVIFQALENQKEECKSDSIQKMLGKSLKKAGPSICVTSLTDVLAFGIGTKTVVPFFRSFCVFASIGVFSLFMYGITFFVSCLAVDERRVKQNRNCFTCRIQKDWKPNKCSDRNIQEKILSKYVGPFLMNNYVRAFVMLTTIGFFVPSLVVAFKLEKKFDPMWYLQPQSYPILYYNKLNEYFPQFGKHAGIYLGPGINYFSDKEMLYDLYYQLQQNPYVNTRTLDFWYIKFNEWLNTTYAGYPPEDEDELKGYLYEFLFLSPAGSKYIDQFRFSSFPTGDYNITATMIPVHHINVHNTNQQIQAMESVKDIIHKLNVTGIGREILSYSMDYISWTTNKHIGDELPTNLILTIIAVGMTTTFMVQEMVTAIVVMLCVVFTIVDLLGSMYLMGLTIEVSTSLMVLLCAGLAVDYAAHIGNEFTQIKGSPKERAIKTLVKVGPPVFNGGFSTFLAFIFLWRSDSYLFTTFCKLFGGVVIIGLYHGLVFLLDALSLIARLKEILQNYGSSVTGAAEGVNEVPDISLQDTVEVFIGPDDDQNRQFSARGTELTEV